MLETIEQIQLVSQMLCEILVVALQGLGIIAIGGLGLIAIVVTIKYLWMVLTGR